MTTLVALICKALFPSISTFETPSAPLHVAACKRCDAGLQTAALLGPRSLRIRRDQGSQSLHMGQQSLQTACKQRTRPTGIANSALRDRLSKKKAMVYLIGEISSDLNEDLRG